MYDIICIFLFDFELKIYLIMPLINNYIYFQPLSSIINLYYYIMKIITFIFNRLILIFMEKEDITSPCSFARESATLRDDSWPWNQTIR